MKDDRNLDIFLKNDHSTSNKFAFPLEFKTSARFPRELQVKALKTISGGPHGLINAAMAFGKSTIACIHAAKYLVDNPEGRVVFVVPEDTIAESFRLTCVIDGQECNTDLVIEEDLVSFGKNIDQTKINEYLETAKYLEWVIGSDLVGSSDKKISELKRFLKNRKSGSPSSRACLVTRQTFVLAFDGMKEDTRRSLFKNTLNVLDEAHTLSLSEEHKFGTMYQWIRKNSDELDIRTLLLTATFFRGDRMRIMTEEQYESLSIFKLPFKDYFNSLKHLEEISIRFVFYDYTKGPQDMIASIIRDRTIIKPIVYLPPRSAEDGHFPPEAKPKEVTEIMEAMHRGWGGIGDMSSKRIKNTSVYKIKISKNEYKIVADFTDPTYIKATKKYLDKIKVNPNGLDAVITLKRAQQGFDWVFCDGVVTLGKRSSMTVIVQIVGRPCRDSEGKKNAVMIFAIPANRAGIRASKEKIRTSVSDSINAIIAHMQLHDIMDPVTIDIKLPGMKKKERIEIQDILSILFRDEKIRNDFEVSVELAFEARERFVDLDNREKKEIINQVMLNKGVSEEDIKKYLSPIFSLFEKRRKRMLNIVAKAVKDSPILEEIRNRMDLPVEGGCGGVLLAYLANHLGVNTFDQIDNAIAEIRTERLSDNELIIALEQFNKKNNRRPSFEAEVAWERCLAVELGRRMNDRVLREVANSEEGKKEIKRLVKI